MQTSFQQQVKHVLKNKIYLTTKFAEVSDN